MVLWEQAYAIVEREGREWRVFMANLHKPTRFNRTFEDPAS